jgi:hypothetical protein
MPIHMFKHAGSINQAHYCEENIDGAAGRKMWPTPLRLLFACTLLVMIVAQSFMGFRGIIIILAGEPNYPGTLSGNVSLVGWMDVVYIAAVYQIVRAFPLSRVVYT